VPDQPDSDGTPGVRVQPDGPYVVRGTPLVRRRQVHSEHGEPMTWQTVEQLETREVYALCRCGGSADKPFCDGTHAREGFDGTETAPAGPYADRARPMPGPLSRSRMTARSASTPGSAVTGRPTCGRCWAVQAPRTASPALS